LDSEPTIRRVRVLINPHSGLWWYSSSLQQSLERHWDVEGIDVAYQYSRSPDDGRAKALRAVEDGADTVLVVGGDGMVNTIGSALVHTGVALGVIPAGSGNGFARHFDIPLRAEEAVTALLGGRRIQIDVGTANGRPFFVTCSLAWDAALVRTFEKSPVRGILPYVFAAAYEFLEYRTQPFQVVLDGTERLSFSNPLLFTVANLTQFGGGARIAPQARHDDGILELVQVARQDAPAVLAQLPRLFQGTLDQLPQVVTRRFRSLTVHRGEEGPMQVDGELVDAPADISVDVLHKALTVLVPGGKGNGRATSPSKPPRGSPG
jgi:diacylglycerol kinase (ATP)